MKPEYELPNKILISETWQAYSLKERQMFQFRPVLAFALWGAITATCFATPPQSDQNAKQDMRHARHSAKEAAKDTGRATKKTAKTAGHDVKKTTRKAANKSAKRTKKAAQKVDDKTQPY